ncbi:hypothetical protein HGRIS_013267 [Hohenbuehelia grisea]|uniref:Uncharacterized protein n=1 Tax=Hohenbuehelia grisea TaxID=104357 RepID=A0ABR3IUY8_9AGAR
MVDSTIHSPFLRTLTSSNHRAMVRFRVPVFWRIRSRRKRGANAEHKLPDENCDIIMPHHIMSPSINSARYRSSPSEVFERPDRSLLNEVDTASLDIQSELRPTIRRLRQHAGRRMSAALAFHRPRDASEVSLFDSDGRTQSTRTSGSRDSDVLGQEHMRLVAAERQPSVHSTYDNLQASWQAEVIDPFAKAPPMTWGRSRGNQAPTTQDPLS